MGCGFLVMVRVVSEVCGSTTAQRSRINKVRLSELAARQWGVVKRSQLEEIGLTPGEITRGLEEHRLHRLYPTVYAVGHSALGVAGKLAAGLFYAGPGAALYGLTGAHWCGFVKDAPEEMHICTPRQRQSVPGLRIHRRKKFDRILHKGLPVTPPAQGLLDIASELRLSPLRKALAEAEYLKLVTLEEVEAVLRRGRDGSARLRAALECHRPELADTKSTLEDKFVFLCERYEFPLPVVNAKVAGWEVDAVWFDIKLAVELDSQLAHGTPIRVEADRQRDLDLRAAGFTVRRYTYHQVTRTPERLMNDLERAAQLARERRDRDGEQHREEDDRPRRAAAAVVAEVEQR
jgi:hypothetical protein